MVQVTFICSFGRTYSELKLLIRDLASTIRSSTKWLSLGSSEDT